MEDKYFDDKLKGILESPPDFDIEPSAITEMQRRLRENNTSQNRRRGFPLLLLLVILPFLFGSIFFYNKYEKLNREISELKNEFKKNTYRKDTIFQKKIIYQYDTIYNVIYKGEVLNNKLSNNHTPEQNKNQTRYIFRPRQMGLYENSFIPDAGWSLAQPGSSLLNRNRPGSTFSLPPDFYSKSNSDNTVPAVVDYLDILPQKKLNAINGEEPVLSTKLKNDYPESKKKKINPLLYTIPNGASIKGTYVPFLYLQNAYGGNGLVAGLNGEVQFPQGRILHLGIEYMDFGIEFEDMDDLPNIPITPPDNPNDNLNEAKAKFTCLQIPLGVRQIFFERKKISPSIYAGMVAAIPLRQRFTYEYLNLTEEYYKIIETKNGKTSFDNLRLGIGASISVWKNFSFEPEIQYQHAFSKDETAVFPVRYWAFQLGVNYKI